MTNPSKKPTPTESLFARILATGASMVARAARMAGQMERKVMASPAHQFVVAIFASVLLALLMAAIMHWIFISDADAADGTPTYSVVTYHIDLPGCSGSWRDILTGDLTSAAETSRQTLVTCEDAS